MISNDEIVDFYRLFDAEIKQTTVNWRIYALVDQGVLNRVSRGKFSIGKETFYLPELSNKIISLNKKLRSDFPYLTTCLWNTSVISEFMIHQPGRYYNLLEVDKDAVESVFYYLKEKKHAAYIEPSIDLINRYIIDEKDPWIVKALVSEAPTQLTKDVRTVTIEKMLVDIYCEPILFGAQQGSEMNTIYKNSFETYSINQSKLLRYASRRRKKEEINNYMNKVTIYRQQ